ncbi:MAG: polysaccharide deacetylase [Rhizobiaceae bacterium]|nr:polysaccharide deacetylase [Rhizobiaceae bacterium]
MLRLCVSVLALACLAALPAKADPPTAGHRPMQALIISFDGAHDLDQWRRSRALAKRTGAHFTYFLSCVFLLSPDTKSAYQPPRMKAGRSNVGFAHSRGEVEQRLYQIRLAAAEGHELASHVCGHFDGGKWTAQDWSQEIDSFSDILRNAYAINGISPEPEGWKAIANGVEGMRAPYLSTAPGLQKAMAGAGLAYDASGVSRGPVRPDLSGPVAHFALPQIAEGPNGRRVIGMDYNLYVRQSGGKENPARAKEFEQRSYDAFRAAFDKEYAGGRAPLQLGFHFVLMNGGAYWRAMERLAEEVCGRPDVACISYRDYLARTGFSLRRAPDSQG